MEHVTTMTLGSHSYSQESHAEFSKSDGPSLAEAFLKQFGTKYDAYDECLTMLIVASAKSDLTTINGCMAARRYMRKNKWFIVEES